ncbi:phosphosulfolactate synthase [Amycolatopsis methanolica 239]|uniref:Phosphosulfolactate synthase n=1 Tax=Amycolatopsis methanolica 239 TaxID=1068978 RepID=A0A076MMU1_AMYME|nr:phosphosulfolactate synthase [Amycolatopsis methanolica]AIJ22148.1 phosphosulfolactate synthase [Amycolatopsis methanolica 239]
MNTGVTMVIDPGLPTGAFTDLVTSHGDHIDLLKFGWGTALVTRDLHRKVAVLREAGIGCFFGGTLFEHYLVRDRLDDYLAFVDDAGATHIEVSHGTIPLSQHDKASYVERMTGTGRCSPRSATRTRAVRPASGRATGSPRSPRTSPRARTS